jgi:DNA invertase Pin-like site-specific DNA recombinase
MMTTAMYIRLSEADGDKPESGSVKNQRDLLTEFISTHPELSGSRVLTFIDDDYAGLNLNRPGFQKMIEQTKKGEINCIVVKDFSRFSRSSVDTSEYLELIFPFLNVRFISVANNYDSSTHKGATAGIEAAVPALIAEMYSRDLSVKVKTSKAVKARRGEYLGSRACYGYVKSKTVKNGLEIDPAAAAVIKRIFSMAAKGVRPSEIARTLNGEGIDTPMAYALKQNPDEKCYRAKSEQIYWDYEKIRKYLTSEIYMGKLVYGKRANYEPGSKKTALNPRADWITAENAVPAIITEDVFIKAQAVIKGAGRGRHTPRKETVFAHKVICGHCGYTMKRQAAAVTYACISSRYNGHEKCIDGVIREDWLKSQVLEAYINAVGSRKLTEQQKQKHEADADTLKAELKKQRQSAQRLKDTKKALFESFTSGKLDEAQYMAENAGLTQQLNIVTQSISDLETKIEQIRFVQKEQGMAQSTEIQTEFTDEMMDCVKSITVYSTSHAIVDLEL